MRRLETLDAYGILDTPPERGFDDVVRLARDVCAAPISLVSLVTGDRQWFKARVGFEACQTTLDRSVCVHALGRDDLLVIPDLTLDARTRDNPLVTGDPRLRFYAGAPLVAANGDSLGSLCVIDVVPRPGGLDPRQRDALRALAGQVMAQLELRRALAERDASLAEGRATVRRHEALLDTQAAMSSRGAGTDAMLDALVAGAMRAVPQADGGVLALARGEETVHGAVAGNLLPHAGLRLPVRGTLFGHCLATGEPVSCPDVRGDDRARRDLVACPATRSALYVPVHRHGGTVGVLMLQSDRVAAFGPGDVAAVRLLAGTLAAGLAEAGETLARRDEIAGRDRYRAVFDGAIDYAIVVLRLDGVIEDWNEGAARILGWTKEEARGHHAGLFFTPDDVAGDVPGREMRDALATGRGVDERWHVRKDGSLFWANGEMMALRDGDGEAIGYLKILRDRTEQRDAAARLHESEAFLRSVLEASEDRIEVLRPDASLDYVNASGRRVLGIADGEHVSDRQWGGSWEGPVATAAHAAVYEAAAGGVGRFDGPARSSDGVTRWWDVQVTSVRDTGGRVGKLLAVSRDVTARRAAESALAASEGNLRTILGTVPVGILFAEAPSGRVVGGNSRIESILGHPVIESPGIEDYGEWNGFRADGLPVMPDEYPVSRIIREGLDRAEAEVLFERPDGTRTWTHVVAGPVRDGDGRLTGVVAALTDIDARKRAEEARDLMNNELSHRMKNLLAMVQAIATQTMRGAEDLDSARTALAARLVALGAAHDVLLGGTVQNAGLASVVRGGVGVHDDGTGRFAYAGPDVEIGERAALSLVLMLHELATNAAKYGALSGQDGRVSVAWELLPGPGGRELAITWQEAGGPAVSPPTRRGFGSKLIERGLAATVGGRIELEYPPSGVRCAFRAPLANFSGAA